MLAYYKPTETKHKMKISLVSSLSSGLDTKQADLYARWKTLINMTPKAIKTFKEKQMAAGNKDAKKYPGLKPKQASALGISSGVQSARWIMKMKTTPVKLWTPVMWTWCAKQVSFVSRMLGNPGPLTNDKGEPTRKTLSLMIWGHNPL